VDTVLIDKMNYSYRIKGIYRRNKLEEYLSEEYFDIIRDKLTSDLEAADIEVEPVF